MSSRVRLSPLEAADGNALFRWVNDRDLRVLAAPYAPVHEAGHRAWLAGLADRDDLIVFGIRLCENDRLIGTCQLQNISALHRSADIQIRIGEPDCRARGYGTEAIRGLVRFAFHDRQLHRLGLQVFADNMAAMRCYEKVGFVREGVQRSSVFIDGRYVDVVLMGLLQAEYQDD